VLMFLQWQDLWKRPPVDTSDRVAIVAD
jgi:hypothetical protein